MRHDAANFEQAMKHKVTFVWGVAEVNQCISWRQGA